MVCVSMGSYKIIEMESLEKIGPLLRVFAHPIRLRILDFLETTKQPQRVSAIVAVCDGIQQSIISQQLKILRDSGLITATKKSTSVYYTIQSPLCVLVLNTLRGEPFRYLESGSGTNPN